MREEKSQMTLCRYLFNGDEVIMNIPAVNRQFSLVRRRLSDARLYIKATVGVILLPKVQSDVDQADKNRYFDQGTDNSGKSDTRIDAEHSYCHCDSQLEVV